MYITEPRPRVTATTVTNVILAVTLDLETRTSLVVDLAAPRHSVSIRIGGCCTSDSMPILRKATQEPLRGEFDKGIGATLSNGLAVEMYEARPEEILNMLSLNDLKCGRVMKLTIPKTLE